MASLTVQIRDKKNNKPKNIRKEGFIPAVLYGPEVENILVAVDKKEFQKIFRQVGESEVLDLIVKEGDKETKYETLIHDVQIDPLTNEVLHIDFFAPSKTKKVKVTVPILFTGVPPAVKEKGGILIKEIQELEIKAPLKKIPKEIEVNLDVLKDIDSKIYIKDLKLDKDITILREPDEIIANIIAPEKEEVVPEEQPAKTETAQAPQSSQKTENLTQEK